MNLENYFTTKEYPEYTPSDINTMNYILSQEIVGPVHDDEFQIVVDRLIERFGSKGNDMIEFKSALGNVVKEAYENSLFFEGDNIGGYHFTGDTDLAKKYTTMIQDLCDNHGQHWQQMELNFVEFVESLGLPVNKL